MSKVGPYNFVLLKLKDGADQAAAEANLVQALGANPEKLQRIFTHLKEKGPVAIEKNVSRERVDELKRVWEAAGVATTEQKSLTIIETEATVPQKAEYKCPSCGHDQAPKDDQTPCPKCGVFARKFLEQQRKNELYQLEKEKLERVHHFRKLQEEKEAREAAERAEIAEMRKRIEKELGLGEPESRFGWITGKGPGGKAARISVAGAVFAALLTLGLLGRELMAPKGVSAEDLAKSQSVQAKQNAAQMQNMVAQLIKGSKKMAQQSGAAAQFQQALFAQDDKDAELQEQLQAAQAVNSEISDAVAAAESGGSAPGSGGAAGTAGAAGAAVRVSSVEANRAEGLAAAARTFAESGGELEDAERALAASLQSARSIKDASQRNEALSAVAGAQLEIYTQNALDKASVGDWRAADKSYAKALGAAGEITAKAGLAIARGVVAKTRADTGDYGGATLLFLEAMKAAEELPEPRARAIAVADVARLKAQTTNELEGAAEQGFAKALAIAATLGTETERAALANEVALRRVQAACDIASFLLGAGMAAKEVKPFLELAAKEAVRIADPLVQAKALRAYARVMAEFEGETAAVNALTERVAKLAGSVAEPARDRVAVAAARMRAETIAASAKFIAGKGDKAKAKTAFLAALKASGSIATKSQDPAVRGDVAKERAEALGEIARYMRTAGDRRAAARVFVVAVHSAGPAQKPKVVSWMVRELSGG